MARNLNCSLCSKFETEVFQIIAGVIGYICDECAESAAELCVENKRELIKRTQGPPQTPFFRNNSELASVNITGIAELVVEHMARTQKFFVEDDLSRFVQACARLKEPVNLDAMYAMAGGLSLITEDTIARAVSVVTGLPLYNLRRTHVSRLATHIMNQSLAERVKGFPVRMVNGLLEVAVSDPAQPDLQQVITKFTCHDVQLAIAKPSDIAEAIARCYIQDWDAGISDDSRIKAVMNRVYGS